MKTNTGETSESTIDTTPNKSDVSPQTEGKWFMENGVIFEGSKEQADKYAETVKAEAEKSQFNVEATVNKPSDRPLRSREESAEKNPAFEQVVREQGFSDEEFGVLTAAWAIRTAEEFESGRSKDDSESKEQAKLHRAVADLLDSDSGIASNIDQHVAKLESQLEAYRDNKLPTHAVEWKLKVAQQTKEMMEDQKDHFETTAKDVANGEHWASGDTHGDMEIARKTVAKEYIAEHNADLLKRRAEAPAKKEAVVQNARATAARSTVDEALEAAKRLSELPDGVEAPKTPAEAKEMIDTSPDLMMQLLAEADSYADEQIKISQDPEVRDRIKVQQDRLKTIAQSFSEMAKLWRADGQGKTYEEFYEELTDSTQDETVMRLQADTSPGWIQSNPLFANRKLAMMKQMSNPR